MEGRKPEIRLVLHGQKIKKIRAIIDARYSTFSKKLMGLECEFCSSNLPIEWNCCDFFIMKKI